MSDSWRNGTDQKYTFNTSVFYAQTAHSRMNAADLALFYWVINVNTGAVNGFMTAVAGPDPGFLYRIHFFKIIFL